MSTQLLLHDPDLGLRGDLRLTVRNALTGKVQRRVQIKNTITYGALGAVVQLLAQTTGTTITDYKMASLRVGIGGATAPAREQTALVSPIATLALSDTYGTNKYPTVSNPFELKLLVTLDAATANGSSLNEAGLFLSNGTMFARQVHPVLNKTSAIVIDYDWRIDFTA